MRPTMLLATTMLVALCLSLDGTPQTVPTVQALTAQTDPQPILISQPAGPIETRELLQLWVTGLPAEKFDKCRVSLTPSKGTILIPGAWGGKLYVILQAREPGDYKLEIIRAVAEDVLQDASVTITVEGENRPDPPEPPVPDGQPFVYLLSESSTISPQERTVQIALRKLLEKNSILYRFLDPDTETVDNWGKSFKDKIAAEKISLPALVVSVLPENSEGKPDFSSPAFVVVEPLPMDPQKAVELVEEALP